MTTKSVREMTALELLDAHCDALEAENDRLRGRLRLIAGRDSPEGLIARETLGLTLEQARKTAHQPEGDECG